jgi:hypothetical protein
MVVLFDKSAIFPIFFACCQIETLSTNTLMPEYEGAFINEKIFI